MCKEMYNIPGLQKVNILPSSLFIDFIRNLLKQICDILAENPSWSLAHLVAHFNLVDKLSNPQVAELIDYPDHIKYMTPFQLAIKSKNLEMVKVLIGTAKLDHLDYNSSSIFHYAANTSKEMITILTSKSTVNLNHCNLDGYTPLHAACLSNNPDCVNALLCAGADVNISARHVSNMQSRNPSTSSKCYARLLSLWPCIRNWVFNPSERNFNRIYFLSNMSNRFGCRIFPKQRQQIVYARHEERWHAASLGGVARSPGVANSTRMLY